MMALSVKNKVWLGTLFLFLLLLLTGGVGIYYMAKLKLEGKNVLQDNYESIFYCHNMQKQLDDFPGNYLQSVKNFEVTLKQQESNITEPGEEKLTNSLRAEFNRFRSGDTSKQTIRKIREHIQTILSLNMHAIQSKSMTAEKTADDALSIIITLGSIVFLIAFTFILNFPSVVTNPISRLTEAIKEIGNKNYKHRVHIDNKDEFGILANAFNEMAERLEFFESSNLNKLLFEKSRAEAVINSLKDASIGIDKNNIVLFANYQALQLLGITSEDVVGKPVNEINKRNDLFRFLLEEKGNVPFKVVVDNKENYFTREVVEIAQDGSSSRVIALRNITTFKELDVAKTNFIATVSHELKTPLASSDFSLKLLEDSRVGKLTDEQKELIRQLKNDNLRMLRILSELLNMSQVEAGKIQLDIQPVDPYQIVENSVRAITSSAKEKALLLEKKMENDLPNIRADADKINWVLNNFLTNAIKYAPIESTIIISVKKSDSQISFSVTDSGQGIEEAYLVRIFERYFQVPGRSDKKGSGIGLAICKEFIEAMGGKIWVRSQVGEGSTFGFDIPASI